jgi:hypothetical protein
MFIVEDGTGLPNSNSYCSVEEFRLYWSDRGADLSVYTDAQIEQGLVKATQYIDKSFRYIGVRPTQTQALNWPRWYAYSEEGYVYSGVPKDIISEACLLSLSGTQLFTSVEDGIAQKTENVGPVQTTYVYQGQQTGRVAYQSVQVYLKDLIKSRSNRIRRY